MWSARSAWASRTRKSPQRIDPALGLVSLRYSAATPYKDRRYGRVRIRPRFAALTRSRNMPTMWRSGREIVWIEHRLSPAIASVALLGPAAAGPPPFSRACGSRRTGGRALPYIAMPKSLNVSIKGIPAQQFQNVMERARHAGEAIILDAHLPNVAYTGLALGKDFVFSAFDVHLDEVDGLRQIVTQPDTGHLECCPFQGILRLVDRDMARRSAVRVQGSRARASDKHGIHDLHVREVIPRDVLSEVVGSGSNICCAADARLSRIHLSGPAAAVAAGCPEDTRLEGEDVGARCRLAPIAPTSSR
jgi:hypothetical protein